jgi:hypothetical protein
MASLNTNVPLATASSDEDSPTTSIWSHPVLSDQSELTCITDEELESLNIELILHEFGNKTAQRDRAANILLSFYNYLGHEGRKVLATEIKTYIGEEEKMAALAKHLMEFILVPCTQVPYPPHMVPELYANITCPVLAAGSKAPILQDTVSKETTSAVSTAAPWMTTRSVRGKPL